MVIIAVGSVVVYPSVRSGSNQRQVRSALQHFVSAVRRASSIAILRRETVELWLWPDRGEYAVVTRDRSSKNEEEEEEDGGAQIRSLAMVGRDDEESGVGPGRTILKLIELPEVAAFGEVEGGRFVSEELSGGAYIRSDAVLFEFYPTGSSSGGKVELEFDVPRQRLSYKLVINPLVSTISMEE